MKNWAIIALFLLASPAWAGENPYAVSLIPAELLKNANVVKRMEQISFEIVNTGEAIEIRKYALTILNEKGDEHAGFIEYYDKLHEIKDIEGVLFDAAGRELKKLKNKQIIDFSGVDENILFDDNRRKYHHFYHKVYPYTVQYEVRIKRNGTLFFPVWDPREDEHFAVEQSSISIIHDPAYIVRFKAFNYTGSPVFADHDKKKKKRTWEVKNLPAIETEYAAPDWYKLNPQIFFGPTDFELENYKGRMDSWQDFGKFVYSLKQGRDQLPESVKKIVHEISAKYPDPRERIAQLYAYLQKSTRYIAIMLGIGGWQPFDAKYVASKSYGDCKALTNYMYSLLKEAGINSIYTLIRAGRNVQDVIPDFPSSQFNHVILAVPVAGDTIWLECTNQSVPPGYLGLSNCDRYALLVTETGGQLIRTPAYKIHDNLSTRKITAALTPEATLHIHSTSEYTGLQQDMYHYLVSSFSKDKIKEILQEQLDLGTYDISQFEYKEYHSRIPSVHESLNIIASNYATITGRRLFIIPNIMTRHYHRLTADIERKYDLELGWGYLDKDTVKITIPEGYKPESVPPEINLSGQFGKYHALVKLDGDTIYYYRSFTFNGGNFPASSYPELVKFYDAIYKADRNRIVLVRDDLKGF